MTNIRERALNKGALPYQPPVLSRAAHARVAGSLLQALQPSQQNTQARCGQLAAFDKKKKHNKKKNGSRGCVCRMWCVHIIVRYIYIYVYICAGLLLPKLVELFNCSDVTVANFTAQNRCGPEAFDDQTILTSIQNRSFIKTGSGQT